MEQICMLEEICQFDDQSGKQCETLRLLTVSGKLGWLQAFVQDFMSYGRYRVDWDWNPVLYGHFCAAHSHYGMEYTKVVGHFLECMPGNIWFATFVDHVSDFPLSLLHEAKIVPNYGSLDDIKSQVLQNQSVFGRHVRVEEDTVHTKLVR